MPINKWTHARRGLLSLDLLQQPSFLYGTYHGDGNTFHNYGMDYHQRNMRAPTRAPIAPAVYGTSGERVSHVESIGRGEEVEAIVCGYLGLPHGQTHIALMLKMRLTPRLTISFRPRSVKA
jgi:hypothetical protein